MRLVFVGAVRFSRHCLAEILANGGDVSAVVTLEEDRFHRHSDAADLAGLAAEHGIPVHRVRNISDPSSVSLLRSLQPDLILVLGWSQLLSREVLDIPRLGCIGSHPALLPRGRGRHPLVWSLVEGLDRGGLTFFMLGDGADDGDIVWQRPFDITLEDDAASLYDKIERLASEAMAELVPALRNGALTRHPQNHASATYWRKRGYEDGEIRWSAPSMTSYNLVRALTRPYVGAHTFLAGDELLIWRARLADGGLPDAAAAFRAGTVFDVAGDGSFSVRTGDGFLRILECDGSARTRIVAGAQLGSSQ